MLDELAQQAELCARQRHVFATASDHSGVGDYFEVAGDDSLR
jgi:hypothetical protein